MFINDGHKFRFYEIMGRLLDQEFFFGEKISYIVKIGAELFHGFPLKIGVEITP